MKNNKLNYINNHQAKKNSIHKCLTSKILLNNINGYHSKLKIFTIYIQLLKPWKYKITMLETSFKTLKTIIEKAIKTKKPLNSTRWL